MKVTDPGHFYELATLDQRHPEDMVHYLRFVKRVGPKYPGNDFPHSGTTVQEALRACYDRLRYVWSQRPCWETKVAAKLLYWAIWVLERRAARLHDRPTPSAIEALWGRGCLLCGHVGCSGDCH